MNKKTIKKIAKAVSGISLKLMDHSAMFDSLDSGVITHDEAEKIMGEIHLMGEILTRGDEFSCVVSDVIKKILEEVASGQGD